MSNKYRQERWTENHCNIVCLLNNQRTNIKIRIPKKWIVLSISLNLPIYEDWLTRVNNNYYVSTLSNNF